MPRLTVTRRALFRLAALTPLAALPVHAAWRHAMARAAADGCGVPVARDDGWPVASANDDTLIDRDALCATADRLAASSETNVHAVLVARRGKLVFERYFGGSDEVHGHLVERIAFDADTLNDMRSVTKSVASLAVGIAVDRGLIRSVNEPIFNFFPELSDLRSTEKDRIQLLHALTMAMGARLGRGCAGQWGNNDEERMKAAPDARRYVLGLPMNAPAGQDFFYNTGALVLVSAAVRKATGRTLDEFARATLLEPLGITNVEWFRVKGGDSDAGSGLRLRPRDMAKIGQLVLAGGRWNDRQIVSKAWIDASITPYIDGIGAYFYGYLWWLGRSLLKGHEVHWAAAYGRGGQSIHIVPELDLVIVVTAGFYQDYSPKAQQVLANILRDVLRAASAPG
jgi:CubicO group peptidase (beta-lactamase class C family)